MTAQPVALSDTGALRAPAIRRPRAERRSDVDAARVIAIAAVVGIHVTGTFVTGGPRQADAADPALVLNALVRSGAPLFFAISGWALLRRPAEGYDSTWLRIRLARLLVPLAAWTFIYLVHAIVYRAISGATPPWEGSSPGEWLSTQLQLALFGPGVRYHLWFMYFLVAISLVVWLVRTRASRGQAIAAAAVVGAIGLAQSAGVAIAWTGFPWALGYAVLGYALFELRVPPAAVAAILYAIASAGIYLLGTVVGFGQWPYFNPAPTVLAATIGVIWLVRATRLGERGPTIGSWAPLIFGVYLVHPLVMDLINLVAFYPNRPLASLPGLVRVLVLLASTLSLSFGVVSLWHRSRALVRVLG